MKRSKPFPHRKMIRFLALIVFVSFSLNANAQRPPGHWKQVYENEVFTESILVISQDSVLFYNCTFRDISEEKHALELRNCTNALIKDCKFYDIATEKDGNVIALRDNQEVVVDNCEIYDHRSEGHSGAIKMWGGLSENITIKDNYIHDIAGNGVISAGNSTGNSKPNPAPHDVPNLGLKVLNNRIVNVGLSPDLVGNSPKHGMYIKAMDPLIEGNYVEATHDGAGISIRSTGIVRNNFVMNTKISGITCSNMKPAGPSGKLIIENNVVVQKWEGTPTWASPLSAYFTEDPYPVRYHTAIVRFNTVIGYPDINPDLRLVRVDDYGLRTDDQAYGNLIVDLRETPRFWKNKEEVEDTSNNYTRTSIDDFVDPANLDFRLKESSDLIDLISSESKALPTSDRDKNALVFSLEPGAHQYVADCQQQSLALDASIHSVSDEQPGNGAANLVGGNLSNRWSAKTFPQWVIVDLGQPQNINEVQVAPYLNRAYQYKVFASRSVADLQGNDPSALVLDRSGNPEPGEQKDKFDSRSARYVKLLVTGASDYSGEWVSLHEFRIFQPSDCEATSAFPDPAKWYYLENKACAGDGPPERLDADNCSSVDVDPGSAQDKQWRFALSDDGSSYFVINRACGSYLDADNCQTVDLHAPTTDNDKRWALSLSDDGVHYLLNNQACGGKNLDTDNCGGVKVTGGSQNDKRWKLVEAGDVNARQGVVADKGALEQKAIEDELLVYPNPATGQLRVKGSEDYQLIMYDANGRAVLQHDDRQGGQQLDVSHLRPGLYVVKLRSADQRETQQRIIIE